LDSFINEIRKSVKKGEAETEIKKKIVIGRKHDASAITVESDKVERITESQKGEKKRQ
jgi:hypothetical protein